MATKTFTNVQALLSAINQEMAQAMTEVSSKGLEIAKQDAQDFYSQGHPKRQRTGKYGDAVATDGVQRGGNSVSTEIYKDEAGHGYTDGTFSALQVWSAAEANEYGVLGKPGRWAQTEKDVEQLANDVFAKHFK